MTGTGGAEMARGGATRACDDCLRRADLVAALAGWLEIEWRRGEGPARVLALPDGTLLEACGRAHVRRRHAAFDPRAARAAVRAAGLVALCRCDAAFPRGLRELPDPPAVLHVAGDLGRVGEPHAVAVVGARRATGYGLGVAADLGRGLAAAGVAVVSGLALGIDAAAHEGALERAGARGPSSRRVAPAGPAPAPGGAPAAARAPAAPAAARAPAVPPSGGPAVPPSGAPVAVLACGADRPYPASKRRLYDRVRDGGAVVSEMPPGTGVHRWAFVARNRIIAALARVVVVVEAAERSGSLTTADLAAELGRTVAAVPGRVTCTAAAGTNALLRDGAALVRGPADVLDLLAELTGARYAAAPPPPPVAEPQLRRLLEAVGDGHDTLPMLAARGFEPRAVLAGLGELEARGLVRRAFGGRYARVS